MNGVPAFVWETKGSNQVVLAVFDKQDQLTDGGGQGGLVAERDLLLAIEQADQNTAVVEEEEAVVFRVAEVF